MGESPQPYQHVGVGLLKYSSLMETFSLPPPHNTNLVVFVNMISSYTIPSDPWIIPNFSNLDIFSNHIPLSLI